MIVKSRGIPLRLQMNHAISRRLPPTHPKRAEVMQDAVITRAGHKGETNLDYYTSLLHEEEFHIFQGLRLNHEGNFFQIDSLLLSSSLALIIEVKNMLGSLSFNPHFNQMTRTHNEKSDTFDDPILQAKRHRLLFQKWLQSHHFPHIPIEYLVFSSNPSTTLLNPFNDPEVYKRVCPPGKIIFKIEEVKSRYTKEILSAKELKKITKALIKNDMEPTSHLGLFQIYPSEFLTGVQCSSCEQYAMERYSGAWHCPHCEHSSKDAHIQAIEDYFLLFKRSISNSEFRKFIHLKSPKLASKLLTSMNLHSMGSTKARRYENK